ncbi:MAG: alpha/beta fold hydrolase [Desulfobacterales bacterium]
MASIKCGERRGNPMLEAAEEMILETGNGVRLLGSFSAPNRRKAKGLVIMLHGWEGSIDSSYMLRTGRCLFDHGYAVFRLNFRDHGVSHHLNTGLFYATLLEEVFQAVKQAAEMLNGYPAFLLGFSLGGNFALRIARQTSAAPIGNLKHIVSISPVLDPAKATDRIENCRYIRRYFLKKWQRSLGRKQAQFPHIYDFSEIMSLKSIRKITDELIRKYSDLESTDEYFKGYTLKGGDLKKIATPTTLIVAEDDPIIPIGDFHKLQLNSDTNMVIHRHGGHNGFIHGFALKSWYENKLVALFNDTLRSDSQHNVPE